jgi:ABC-2 type transport system permease protein
MFGLGKAAESLDWLLTLSFFSAYKPQKMVSLWTNEGVAAPWSLTQAVPDASLPPLVYPLILIGFGLAFYAVALVCFAKRDLPAPL